MTIMNEEIMNENVQIEAEATVPNMTLDAVLEGMNQNLDTQLEKITENRQKVAADKKAVTINDTRIGYVMASRGYVQAASLVIADGAESLEMTPVIKGDATNKINVLKAIGKMILTECAKKNKGIPNKKNIVIYTQGSEAIRFGGMINRIRNGSNEYLTKKEIDFVKGRADMGAAYLKAANSLFGLLKRAMDDGYNIRVTDSDSIQGYQISNNNLDESFDGKEVRLRNGSGRIGNTIIATQWTDRNGNLRGFALNGTHKLVNINGRIMVERPVSKEKNPEGYYALQLMQVISKNISVAAENNTGETAEEVAA